jgi:hypothetical protein
MQAIYGEIGFVSSVISLIQVRGITIRASSATHDDARHTKLVIYSSRDGEYSVKGS